MKTITMGEAYFSPTNDGALIILRVEHIRGSGNVIVSGIALESEGYVNILTRISIRWLIRSEFKRL